MRNRFYTLDTFLCFPNLVYKWFSDKSFFLFVLYQVFLAGNTIPITDSYWWCSGYFPTGITLSFLSHSFLVTFILWIEWFSCVSLVLFWWVYHTTQAPFCQYIFEIFFKLIIFICFTFLKTANYINFLLFSDYLFY